MTTGGADGRPVTGPVVWVESEMTQVRNLGEVREVAWRC